MYMATIGKYWYEMQKEVQIH